MCGRRGPLTVGLLAWVLGFGPGAVRAQVEPAAPVLAAKVVRGPSLSVRGTAEEVAGLPPVVAESVRGNLAMLGVSESAARVDRRSGRLATIVLSRPLLPGEGRGNDLAWSSHGFAAPPDSTALSPIAAQALIDFLASHRSALGIDTGELSEPKVTIQAGGDLIQIHAPRIHRGVPVRDSKVTAVIDHGNLVLLGATRWGSIRVRTRPGLSIPEARSALASHLAPFRLEGAPAAHLELIPTASPTGWQPGHGYRYRLAWVLDTRVAGVPGNWEALIDAHTGELLSFASSDVYGTPRKVTGGVYPSSNDGSDPVGVEQAGYPMPWADADDGTHIRLTDSGGNLAVCVDGDITTSLDGQYAAIEDVCGQLSEFSSGDLDLGTGSGNDCAIPTGASLGNTHSSRTVFYTLNRMHEAGRGQLPGNPWLEQGNVPAITNFPSDLFLGCNALWDGTGVLFTTSAEPSILLPVPCSNTGELAAVVVHEWAHGLDDNDADGTVSNPPEGIADVIAGLWTGDSCIGRGFYEGTPCSSATIPDGLNECLTCDGVREIDWRQRSGQIAHDVAFIDANCSPPLLGAGGPCGGSVHCEGHLVSEAAWDMAHHDLKDAPFSLDPNTALEITARLFYLGSGLVGDWFQCTPGAGTGDGCNADSGYLNLLAVDDDNGNLLDGTPHMTAIHAAFDRHGIACDIVEMPVNSGCSAAPTQAPTLSAQPVDRGAALGWTAVAGASSYHVFRNEGAIGCSAGKVKVAETTNPSFVDQGLQNGFNYNYIVIPVGASGSCLGPASACASVVPATGPNLGIDELSATLLFLDGDGDTAIDNCESVSLSLDIHNIGSAPLTNVTLTGVEVLSHPATVTVTSALPALVSPSLGLCEVGSSSFTFLADGLAFNDALLFEVRYTADELAGRDRTTVLRFGQAESDFQALASATFDFESDLGGWQEVDGIFDRTDVGGGAQATDWYVASSDDIANQCDQIRSPLMRLQTTSTLSLHNNFDIEPLLDIEGLTFWFDRANVGVVDPVIGTRTPVDPDGGRLYNAGGTDGTCATANQDGWAGSQPTWAESTWSASALGSAELAGKPIQLDVAFGTDDGNWDGISRYGFWFDQVTVTDLDLLVADAQSDVCVAPACNSDAVCDPGENRCSCSIDCGAPDQVLSNVSIDTVQVFEDCSSLTVGPAVAILDGGDLTLDAPKVTLREGLTVEQGGNLRLRNPTPPPTQ